MSWLDLHTTLFFRPWANTGDEVTFREVLSTRFHDSWKELCQLKKLNPNEKQCSQIKSQLKSQLQCFTPAATVVLREKERTVVGQRTGLFQLDFDKVTNVEGLKKIVYQLPFIALCATSCSGQGFYALAMIAEPEKLTQYGEHLFSVFKRYGINVDTSKGRNESDLRFVHYDCNMLIRDEPAPLRLLEYSYRPTKRSFNTGSDDPFNHARNVVTKKYGPIAAGNQHNYIWLFCKVLSDHGVSQQAAEEYVYKNFLPKDQITTNCIEGAFK